jgi:DNA-binding transcriptional LysR family regulator
MPVHSAPIAFSKAGGNRESIKPEPRVFANDAQALYRLARAGAGLAIVPDFLADADLASGFMQNVLPDWELNAIEVFAVWPANAPKHGLVHLLLDALTQQKT